MYVCCCNRKGGVGKTSIAGNLAHELARTHKTILIDADPQGSLSSWLSRTPFEIDLADVLQERVARDQAIVAVTPGLDLLPTRIHGELRQFAETRAANKPYAIADLCAGLDTSGYQFVIIDLSPGLGTFEQGAIAAMDRALLVVEPEYLSVDGLGGLLEDIQGVIRDRRARVRYDWLIANRVHAGFVRHRLYLDALRSRWSDYRLFMIKQGAAVSESQTMHQTVAEYAPNDRRALPGYRELANALRREYGQEAIAGGG